MQANVHMRAHKSVHARTLSEQFFMEIDYVGQPPLLCTAVTLTHGNRGDSFSHRVGPGVYFKPRSFTEQTSLLSTPEEG